MADQAKVGTHWQYDELDAIVADYFDMLAADLAGHAYVKSKHSAMLMAQIGRTHRSVEFKHQNISAVLDELGMPWIPGYKPKRNYQNAIFDAIDRYLTKRSDVLEPVLWPAEATPLDDIFVAPPQITDAGRIPPRLERLSGNSIRWNGTSVIDRLARPGRSSSSILNAVGSPHLTTPIWREKSDGSARKMETAPAMTFFRSTPMGRSGWSRSRLPMGLHERPFS
jgi:hypothetical protein